MQDFIDMFQNCCEDWAQGLVFQALCGFIVLGLFLYTFGCFVFALVLLLLGRI